MASLRQETVLQQAEHHSLRLAGLEVLETESLWHLLTRNIQCNSRDRQTAKQRTPDIGHVSAALGGGLFRKVSFEGKSGLNLGMCVTVSQFRQQVQLAAGTVRGSRRY